jgi:hypothetical protein
MAASGRRRAAPGGSAVRVITVRPAGLDVRPGASNTDAMDPLVIAFAQLVRDRWDREQADRAAARERLRIVRRTDR